MRKNKNVYLNHTLLEYNKKYRNYTHALLKYTKKQVEDFDKQYSHYTYNNKSYPLNNNYLLESRKWWLINDTYYEVPKAPRLVWFRNLNSSIQIGISILGIGGVTSAVIFPILTNTIWKNKTEDIKYEEINVEYDDDYGCHAKTISLTKDVNYRIICTLGEQYSETINNDSFFDITDNSYEDKTNNLINLISVSYNSNKYTCAGLGDTEEKFSELRNYTDTHPYSYCLANYVDDDVNYNNVYIGKNSYGSINHKLEICFTAKETITEYIFLFGFPV